MEDHRLAAPLLERIFRGATISGLTEWELLERYLERRDEVAFEGLVARHGPMVMGVCRRMLADQTDVDDAFQATFLVLVRRARQLGPGDAIGPWLYGVAARVAMRARSEAVRRKRVEPIGGEIPAADRQDPAAERELALVIDQELGRLPSKYRSPIVLCYLEGQTHEEAARQLKWPIGTVKGRLARARDLLRSRLARRGLAPATGALTLVLTRDSTAAVNRELLDRTVKASLKLALGHATAQVVSTSISHLVEGVLTSMFVNTIKSAVLGVVIAGIVLGGVGVMARQGAPEPTKTRRAAARHGGDLTGSGTFATAASANRPVDASVSATVKETETVRDLQQKLVRAARADWEAVIKERPTAGPNYGRAYQASKRLLDVERDVASSPTEVITAHESHLSRIRDIARLDNDYHAASESQLAQIEVYAAEAALWLAQAKAGGQAEKKDGGGGGAPGDEQRTATDIEGAAPDPNSQVILTKLESPIAMAFADETTLEDVLKYIKEKTVSPELPDGIPIYIDPLGLQEAEKSLTSTIKIDLKGVPLRRTFQLILKQLGLIYSVEDGLLYITSENAESISLGPSMFKATPMALKVAKAERYELSVKEMKEGIEYLRTRHQLLAMEEGAPAAFRQAPQAADAEAVKQLRDQMSALLKQMHELEEALKKQAPVNKRGESKPAGGLE
jgi:RNA polymerase sigma factor (sigma-70 family)